jgi:methylmalonyl-CoA/ethylmalonyl-CoA epimerase
MKPELDHIGIAVKNLDQVLKTMRLAFNADADFIQAIPDQKVKIAGFRTGSVTLEYFEPTSDDSPISRFLNKRGNGIHHIALRVSDIEKELNSLIEKGFELIDKKPRTGTDNKKIAFLHPRDFDGILIELCQESD